MTPTFTRATRAQVPLKLGISGPSGSGKTTAALRLARGLVGSAPIALLDTENGSASLYSDLTDFDVLNMNPPYQVGKFTAAIEAASQGGYKCLVIDSASHEWFQLLEEKEALDARGGNSYANWAGITKKHEAFLSSIRNAPIHLILCLRAKDKHEISEKDGKKTVVKLGQGSQMRDGFEYELTTVWDLAMDHNSKASKDRTRMFDGRLEPVTEATGRELAAWLSSGKPMAENTGEAFVPHPTSALAGVPPMPSETGTPIPTTIPTQTTPTTSSSTEPITLSPVQPTDADVTAAFDAAQAEALARKEPPSAAASSFVDGMADGPEQAITREQYEALGLKATACGLNRDALRAYCAKAGKLLPSAHPTLARLKVADYEKLMERLNNHKKHSSGVTWSQHTVSLINATPTEPFNPAPAA